MQPVSWTAYVKIVQLRLEEMGTTQRNLFTVQTKHGVTSESQNWTEKGRKAEGLIDMGPYPTPYISTMSLSLMGLVSPFESFMNSTRKGPCRSCLYVL
jgi:hypothetical protein